MASVPQSKAKRPRKTQAERAADHGLEAEEVGVLDSELFLAFIWQTGGRPATAPPDWRRERPLAVVVDNYQAHKSERVKAELPQLAAAGITLFYLPAYCPEMSRIEPIWNDVKYHGLPQRSYPTLGKLKQAVDTALVAKRWELGARCEPAQLLDRTP